MNKTAVLGLLVALLLPLIGYFIIDGFTSRAVVMPRHYIYDSVSTRTVDGKLVTDTAWHRLPDFNLKNQLGQEVGWDDIGAKVTVANFFFTRCPTICPQLMINTRQLQDGIKSSEKTGNRFPDFIQFLSFSVDPERDSVPQLKKWGDRFQINPENWWLLTGEKKEIYDLSIENMKLGLVDGEGIDTGFFHTDYMVLIDRNRNIRGYYHGLDTVAVAKLSRDIILLALEKDPNRKKFFEGKSQMFAVLFLLTLAGLAALFLILRKDKNTHGITGKKR